jgi:hypothetical protein
VPHHFLTAEFTGRRPIVLHTRSLGHGSRIGWAPAIMPNRASLLNVFNMTSVVFGAGNRLPHPEHITSLSLSHPGRLSCVLPDVGSVSALGSFLQELHSMRITMGTTVRPATWTGRGRGTGTRVR